jgi:hypothetical protein
MTQKRKTWTFSDNELQTLTLALVADIRELEDKRSGDFTETERQELIAKRNALADRINEIRNAFRKDVDPDGMWLERDQIEVKVVPKPMDELYTVVPWLDRWAVVEKANPSRPVGEHLYTQKTHAHRKKRDLNKAARETNAIMVANGGALIL